MEPKDFIAIAEGLVPTGQGAPNRSHLRRAVSTAYYALFHCLARSCADTLIGGSGAVRKTDAWILTYRALNHGSAKQRCRDEKSLAQFPPGIRAFAETFAQMQERRRRADYAPDEILQKSEVMRSIQEAKDAIAIFEHAPSTTRRAFAAYVLFKSRRD